MVINPPNGPIVLGDIPGRATPVPGSVLTEDEHGLATLRRRFKCLTPQYRTVISRFRLRSRDDEFRDMYLVSRNRTNEEGLLSEFECVYKGLTGAVPDAKKTLTRSQQSFSNSLADVTIDIQYISPGTVYKYITTREPSGPIFKSTKGDILVRFWTMTGPSTTNWVDAYSALFPRVNEVVTQFDAEEVYNTPYWEVTETVSKLFEMRRAQPE